MRGEISVPQDIIQDKDGQTYISQPGTKFVRRDDFI